MRIANEIERLRTAHPEGKKSAQWLSDRTHELGHRVGRSRISDLETGRRKRMDVTELMVIAEALGIPPVQLLFPGLLNGESEYLPGKTDTAWNALQRFTGETSKPGDILAAGRRNRDLTLMRILAAAEVEEAELRAPIAAVRPEELARTETRLAELERTKALLCQNLEEAGYTTKEG